MPRSESTLAAVAAPAAALASARLLTDPRHFARNVDVQVAPADATLTCNGTTSCLELAPSQRLPGRGDFTLSAWVHTDTAAGWHVGDLLSQYDASTRTGIGLSCITNAGGSSSQANERQLSFYLTDGAAPRWRSAGRPTNARIAFAFVIFRGRMFVGITDATEGGLGHVFEHVVPDGWIDRGAAPDGTNSVRALAVHEDALYVTTGCDDGKGSLLPAAPNRTAGGRVYRVDEDFRWHDCGSPYTIPTPNQSLQLYSFGGRLYLSSLFHRELYVYDGGQRWTEIPTPPIAPAALAAYRGDLYVAPKMLKPAHYPGLDISNASALYRYDGKTWHPCSPIPGIRIYALATHANQLFAGSWPEGKVHRSATGFSDWVDAGDVGRAPLRGHKETRGEIMTIASYHGEAYAGALPLADVHRYDADRRWTNVRQLDATDVPLRRVWASVEFEGGLFFSTMPSGEILRMDAGIGVTASESLAPGWRHVVARRGGDELALHVDGRCVARCRDPLVKTLDASTSVPLCLGSGRFANLRGQLRDVRLHAAALSAEAIAVLASAT